MARRVFVTSGAHGIGRSSVKKKAKNSQEKDDGYIKSHLKKCFLFLDHQGPLKICKKIF